MPTRLRSANVASIPSSLPPVHGPANVQNDAPRFDPLHVDQFDDNLGDFGPEPLADPAPTQIFKNSLEAQIEAKKVADAFWAVLSPVTHTRGCFEDVVAAFFASISDKGERDKKSKMNEIEMLKSQERRLKEEQKKTQREASLREEQAQKQVQDKEKLKNLVSTTLTSLTNDGVVDDVELKGIVQLLGNLDQHSAQVMAHALQDALRQNDLHQELRVQPMVEWVKRVLGKDADFEAPPTLIKTGQIEEDVAEFIADVLLNSNKTLSEKNQAFRYFDQVMRAKRPEISGQKPAYDKAKVESKKPIQQDEAATARLTSDLNSVQSAIDKKNNEIVQITQQMTQEGQSISGMLNSLHESSMNVIRQMRDGY